MKILITGNMGYIGPSVVRQLRGSCPGAEIIGLDTGFFANCLTNTEMLPECLINMQYFSDIRSIPECVLEGVEAIVHLAAISNDPMGNTYEKVTYDINYKASIELAEKAKRAGARTFVYASSCSMYGAAAEGKRSETSPLNPLTAYAKSKVRTEQDLVNIAGGNFTVTSLRFSTACGMSERLRLDLVLNDFVACAVATKKITILSDGTPWRPLINVKDMSLAIDWAVGRSPANGGEFLAVNIGSDAWNYQVKDLAEAVTKVIPGVEISINKDAPPDKRSYSVNFDLFKRLAPDHQPKVDLMTTIQELKVGLEGMGFRDGDFRNSQFMRLKALSRFREKGLLSENLEWCAVPGRY